MPLAADTYIGRCVACGDDLFDPEEPVGFRVRPGDAPYRHHLEEVGLGGSRPWAGVRLLCEGCLSFFHAVALSWDESENKRLNQV